MDVTDSLTVHYTPDKVVATGWPDSHQDKFSKTHLGFWIYLMTDCILFACLFITHAVFINNTFGGPSGKDIFDLTTVFAETMALLFSSVTCGFALLAAIKKNKKAVTAWLIATFALGSIFLHLEYKEFAHLIDAGYSWKVSAFLSSFFALVGTHGLHISVGLLWITVMLTQVNLIGLTPDTLRRLVIFNLFWHFLDLIWIFIFTFVYLIGVI